MKSTSRHSLDMSLVSLGVLVLVTFFTALYMKGLNSGIPFYYDSLGYSATVGGTFVAVFTIASTAMRLIGGQITDHFSHYRVLLASVAGLFIGVALPAVCDEFAVVMVSRVIQGASFALATNVMTVAVMSSADRKHIGRRVGIKGAGTSLGTMLGALLSTWLLDSADYRIFYVFYAALMLLALVVIFLWNRASRKYAEESASAAPSTPAKSGKTPEASLAPAHTAATDSEASSKPSATGATAATTASASLGPTASSALAPAPDTRTRKQRLRDLVAAYFIPSVAPYLAMSFARRLPKGLCISFILVFAKHAGIAMGAAFFVVAGATTLVCRLGGGKLFDSNKSWLLLPLISAQIVGFAILSLAPSFATLIVAAIGYGISVGTTSPFIKTLTAKAVPQKHWGVANGELYFFGDMGKAVGAFCGGLIIDATAKTFVPEIALGFAIVTSLFTALALFLQHRAQKRSHTA